MTTTFPITPDFTFFDAQGKPMRMTSPILHRFLLDMYSQAGGDTDLVGQLSLQVQELQSKLSSTKGQIQSLINTVEELERRVKKTPRDIEAHMRAEFS